MFQQQTQQDKLEIFLIKLCRDLDTYLNLNIITGEKYNIDDINSEFLSKEFKDHHNSLVASTYAWLRIPVNFMYWNNESSKPQIIPRSNRNVHQTTLDKFPNWRQLVQISISGQLDSVKDFKTQSTSPSIYLEQKYYI